MTTTTDLKQYRECLSLTSELGITLEEKDTFTLTITPSSKPNYAIHTIILAALETVEETFNFLNMLKSMFKNKEALQQSVDNKSFISDFKARNNFDKVNLHIYIPEMNRINNNDGDTMNYIINLLKSIETFPNDIQINCNTITRNITLRKKKEDEK